jgi:type IV secretory pathway TrbF-like protein
MAATLIPDVTKSADQSLPVQAMKEKDYIHNPYLAARRAWDERYGDLITRARNWRAAFFISAVIALLAVGGMIVIAKQARVVPYIVAVDNLGRTVASGPAEQATVADDRLKRAVLNSWVGDWRLVSMDGIAQRKSIDRTYAVIASGSPAQVAISEYYRKDPPNERASKETVDVEVKAIFPSSEKTYEVEWVETTRSLAGTVMAEPQRWKGSFTIVVNPPTDEALARINPLGIYITSAAWSRVL